MPTIQILSIKNNIDHIEIVKGPSAATLYGSGSNGGVILVYTKKAALNSTNINLTTSAGWYDSKWQDKKPFRQIHSFNVSQALKTSPILLVELLITMKRICLVANKTVFCFRQCYLCGKEFKDHHQRTAF
jgi:hypothetical protein